MMEVNKEIQIGKHTISKNSPTYIVAEMSANHNMDFNRAKAIIEAAKKYGFDLKLAGHISGEKEEKKIISLIGSTKNIEYLGEVNEEELVSLIKELKYLLFLL